MPVILKSEKMCFKGFKTDKGMSGIIIEMEMPSALEGVFFARLYARGAAGDAANGDPEAAWRALAGAYEGRSLVAPRQVHGVKIIEASEEEILPQRTEADGVFIAAEARPLASLRFADCTPVVIAGMAERPWMALLHSGFKGTVQNIAAAAVNLALKRHPRQRPEEIWAWIGPAIGRECYSRMKEDPTTALARKSFAAKNISEGKDVYNFDIKGQINSQLIESGLVYDRIFTYDCCTCCRHDYFYSYRAGDEKRRMFLLAGSAKNLR